MLRGGYINIYYFQVLKKVFYLLHFLNSDYSYLVVDCVYHTFRKSNVRIFALKKKQNTNITQPKNQEISVKTHTHVQPTSTCNTGLETIPLTRNVNEIKLLLENLLLENLIF